MKKHLLVIFLLFFCGQQAAAKHPLTDKVRQDQLKASLAAYAEASTKQDVDSLLTFTHPAAFRVLPRAELKKHLAELFTRGNAPTLKKMTFTHIGPARAFSQGYFSRITYKAQMELRRPGDSSPALDKVLTLMIQDRFGTGTGVHIDEKTHIITISRPHISLLATHEGTDGAGWKLIDGNQLKVFTQTRHLPEDLLAKIGIK